MKVRFENNNTKMVISTPKGDHQIDVMSFVHEGKLKYNWFMNHPPKGYAYYMGQKVGFGGSGTAGNSTENLEQCVAQLREYLKKNGYPYTQTHLLKPHPRDTEEHKQFIEKLQGAVQQFQQDMNKPENQPKPFGKGPPEFGQWISDEDIKTGRLKWTFDNYGDFWIIIKWQTSPRQRIQASELIKNYDAIMRGKNANGNYAREMFVGNNPYTDKKPLRENIEDNPLYDEVKKLESDLVAEFPQIEEFNVHLASETHIYLDSLKIKKEERGKGIGSEILKRIGKYADDHDLYVVLHPSSQPRFKAKLDKFYKGAGYVPNKGRKKKYQYSQFFFPTMYRSPRKNNLTEARSPHPEATDNDRKRGFIGVIHNGVIYAYDQLIPNVMEVDHSELINGRNGERWRYFVETPKHTILWNEFPPSKENQFLVEDWIDKKGFPIEKNISLREYNFITNRTKIFENVNAWKDITIDDLDDALVKIYKGTNFSLRSLLNTIVEFYYGQSQEQQQWAKEYISLLNQVAHRVIGIAKQTGVPYFSLSAIKSGLLSQEEFKTKMEEFFPFSIYVAATGDEYDTIGIGVDLSGKILGIEEGNDEATSTTIQMVNKLVNPIGRQVRIYGSHGRDLCFKIDQSGYLPPNLFVSPDQKHAKSHMDLKGERETFTGIININDVGQDSELDWRTIGNVKIDKFRFI